MGTLNYGAMTSLDDDAAVMRDDAALWRAADKVVYSTTLDAVSTARYRIVPSV